MPTTQHETMTTHPSATTEHQRVARLSILAVALMLAACEEAMPVALEGPIQVRVEGRVTDAATGAPVDSVDVLMVSGRIFIDEEGHTSATTDADGLYEMSYRFVDECPGDLRLSVFPPGWFDRSGYQRPGGVDLDCVDGTRQVNFELTRHDDTGTGSGS